MKLVAVRDQKPDKPLVSIGCITYNHKQFIRKALEAFLDQKTSFFCEIIVFDDASTDGTSEILLEYKQKYPHIIKLIQNTENVYSKGVRGLLMRYIFPVAQGKYLAICEGDDYWIEPMKLQKQVEFLETQTEYSFCCTRFKIENNGILSEVISPILKEPYSNSDLPINSDNYFRHWVTQPLTTLMRMSCIRPDQFLRYKYARDIHNYYELLKTGPGMILNFVSSVHIHHPNGVSGGEKEEVRIKQLNEIYLEMMQKNPADLAIKRKHIQTNTQLLYLLCEKRKFPLINRQFWLVLYSLIADDKAIILALRKFLEGLKKSISA